MPVEDAAPAVPALRTGRAYLAASPGRLTSPARLFCAHPLVRRLLREASGRSGLPLPGTAVRASLGLGSTAEHVDRLLAALADLNARADLA